MLTSSLLLSLGGLDRWGGAHWDKKNDSTASPPLSPVLKIAFSGIYTVHVHVHPVTLHNKAHDMEFPRKSTTTQYIMRP